MAAYRHEDWRQLVGVLVEVRKHYQAFRTGTVEEAMPDSSALWLAASGLDGRMLIEAAEGYEVWVEPQKLDSMMTYRMTAAALDLVPTNAQIPFG